MTLKRPISRRLMRPQKPHERPVLSASFVALLWLLCTGCVDHDADERAAGVEDATPHQMEPGWRSDWGVPEAEFVEYRFVWDKAGVARTEDGGWSTLTNRGYSVNVRAAWIVDYSASFVPCQLAARDLGSGVMTRAFIPAVLALFLAEAHAGHGDVADPSAISDGMVETIGGDMRKVRVGPVPMARYCDVHYLVARGDAITQTLPDSPDMTGVSLRMEGSFRGPSVAEPRAFHINTAIAYGTLQSAQPQTLTPLSEQPVTVNGEGGVGVVLVRPMSRLFYDLDLTNLDEEALGRAVLRNLLLQTQFIIYP